MLLRRALIYALILALLIVLSGFGKSQAGMINFYHIGYAIMMGLILHTAINITFIYRELQTTNTLETGEIFQNIFVISTIGFFVYHTLIYISVWIDPGNIEYYIKADEQFRIRYLGELFGFSPVKMAEMIANHGDTDISDFGVKTYIIEFLAMYFLVVLPYCLVLSMIGRRIRNSD